jgi:2-polyprenyl-6-methoxyphenol hydroxylase-like FAD-dependent oxidoreductase
MADFLMVAGTQAAMTSRHAEISGGGIAGLISAVALAQRGWSVCVHERSADLRALGAGITCWNNFARVLNAVGVLDAVKSKAHDFVRRETRDENNRVLYSFGRAASEDDRSFTVTRGDLLSGLASAARALGVDIRTSSRVISAEPRGALTLETGERRPADLVVAADGINSPIRDGLGLLKVRKPLAEGATRLLLPRALDPRSAEDGEKDIEYWAGIRRVFCAPCNATELYLSMLTRRRDTAGSASPVNVRAWTESFPHLAGLLKHVPDRGRWDGFEEVRLRKWSSGKVAIIGDSATAMAPNLAQGGGVAAMNALSMAVYLSAEASVERALAQWELRERGLAERTQSMSYWYGKLNDLPQGIRRKVMKFSGQSAWSIRLRQRTAHHIPTGC